MSVRITRVELGDWGQWPNPETYRAEEWPERFATLADGSVVAVATAMTDPYFRVSWVALSGDGSELESYEETFEGSYPPEQIEPAILQLAAARGY